jgi:hypothetical protein
MLRTVAQRAAGAPPAAHGILHGSVWGYVGAQDRHLLKYAQALHALAVPTVLRATAPTLSAFLRPRHLRALALDWLLALQRDAPGLPGVAWLLSNGGAFVYAHALALLRQDAALPPPAQRFPGVRFAAVVLDSAPVFVEARSSGEALSTALGLGARPLLRAATHAAMGALFTLNANWPVNNTEFFAALARDAGAPRPPPRLLLVCSADDAITDFARVEAFARQCEAAERQVELWRVPSPSPHCTHLLTHRRAYEERLGALLAAAAPPPPPPAGGAAQAGAGGAARGLA